MKRTIDLLPAKILAIMVLVTFTSRGAAQGFTHNMKFMLHADPLITWIGSNNSEYGSTGAKAGFDIGLNALYYFAENYAASTGISFLAAGGRQIATENHTMVFTNFTQVVAPGDEMIYNLRYINIPLGIRLQTNQNGPLTYFTDLGLDIRMRLKATVDLPAYEISDENATSEVYGINAGWHVIFGLEYEVGTESSIIAGLGYDQDFFDVTKDLSDVFQPQDRSRIHLVRFRFGYKF
ncbi:MAG: porin family protein [Bacteroidales bacterium]